jgi:dihydroorotate dehydrogenase
MKSYPSFFDPKRSFFENYKEGPFHAFADEEVFLHEGEPTYEFLGHKIYLPFGISAGPLPNSRFIRGAFDKGFDINVAKSVRSREIKGHPMPNLFPIEGDQQVTLEEIEKGVEISDEYKQPLAAANSFGIPSVSPEEWQDDMRKSISMAGKGQLLICAVQGTPKTDGDFDDYLQDYVKTSEMVADTGAEFIELNFSCPNEGKDELLCYDIDKVTKIVKAVRSKLEDKHKLFIKTAYYPREKDIAKLVQNTANLLDGYALINTLGGKVINNEGKPAFGFDRPTAGISGAPIKWAGLEMVEKFDKLRKKWDLDFKIIGIGGVTKPKDYREYRDKGADIVMAAVGAMWNPYLAQEIWRKYKNNL